MGKYRFSSVLKLVSAEEFQNKEAYYLFNQNNNILKFLIYKQTEDFFWNGLANTFYMKIYPLDEKGWEPLVYCQSFKNTFW